MILVFLEIIEINFCGLNQNLKRNSELRALSELTESSVINEDDCTQSEEKVNQLSEKIID